MAEASNTTVTLQVHRFTPRPERAERARGGSPFAKKGSPFGGGSDSAARRRPRGKQWVQEYTIPARPSDTVLDCLLTIKRTVNPTLAFRYSCGHGMCGSDAVAINGTPALLCTATIRDWAKQPGAMPEVDDEGFRHTGTEAEESDDSAENVANAAAAQNSAANGSLGVIELASLPGLPAAARPHRRHRPYAQPDQEAHPVSSGGRRARHHRRRQGGRVRIPAEPRTTRQIRAAEQLHRLRRVRRRLPGVRRRRRPSSARPR